MLIVLEGVDGSGKTSLANRIRKELGQYCMLLRSSGPPPLYETVLGIEWLTATPRSLPLVVDRLPLISEYVYGPILRGKCGHGLSVEQIATWLKSRPSLLIHCRPSFQHLQKAIHAEIQLPGVVDNLRHLVNSYDRLTGTLENLGVQSKKYDWSGPPALTMDSIKSFIRKNKHADT